MASSTTPSLSLYRNAVYSLRPCSVHPVNTARYKDYLRRFTTQPYRASLFFARQKQPDPQQLERQTPKRSTILPTVRIEQVCDQTVPYSSLNKTKPEVFSQSRSRSSLFCCCILNISQKLLPRLSLRIDLSVCSFSTARKYAVFCEPKNTDSQSKKEFVSNVTEDAKAEADERRSILDQDPELRSIIEDIKKDFAKDQSKEHKGKQEPKKEAKSEQEDFTAVEDIEFDYSVAEDIEEYDYIDESKIGQHEVQPEKHIPISLERGKSGVFDLDELLLLLDEMGAENIVSFPVPPEAKFCEHMVVVSAKSRRHLQAINEEMLYIHKRKKSATDTHLVIEGLDKSNWCAMDLGNIVLHVFYGNLREYYDIESLWTLGPENDPKCQDVDKDPYALSPEDLFWLEAAKSTADTTTDTTGMEHNQEHNQLQSQNATSPSPRVSNSDAGWGNTSS